MTGNLITRAAKKTGFDEKLFEQLDKRATNSFLYSLTMFGSVGLNGMSLTDQLYLAQSNMHPRDGRGFLVCYRRPLCRPCTA